MIPLPPRRVFLLYFPGMTRAQRLQRNPRLLFWAKALVNFKTLNAIVTLFYLHRGLTIDQVVWLSGIFGAALLVAEVPTGYMADRFGRKATLLAGVALLAASNLIHWFAFGFPAFAVAFVVMAFSKACFSGTEEALLYDSLREAGREGEMLRQNSRLLAAQNLPKILLPFLGAVIAQGLTDGQFRALIGIDLAGLVVAVILLMRVTEPEHRKDVAALEKGIFHESVETIRAHPALFVAAMNKLIPFVATMLVWRLYQPYLLAHGIPALWLGVFYVIVHSVMFSLKWAAEAIEARFGSARVLHATAALMAAFLAVAIVASSPIVLFAAFALFFIAQNIREPMYAHWIHRHIRSRSRATTLSNLNVFQGVIDVPVMFAGGALAAQDPRLGFALAAALCVSTLVFFRVRADDSEKG